jgi:uncharacterized oxidoreductase
MDLTGNTIFIPGATSGIGLALARRFKDRGNTVIVGGRRTELLDQLAGEGFATVRIDTSDAASVATVAEGIIAEHPDLNALVTMAGIMRPEDWHRPAGFLETAEATVTTNLLGPIRLIAAFVEHFRNQPKATILTVSSGLASVPLAVTPTYNATKAAIHMLSESIRLQLADTDVQVVEIVPPAVQTALMGQEDDPHAMPLDAYADETMALLEADPDAGEILVERVKFLRNAEKEGRYDDVVATLNAPR